MAYRFEPEQSGNGKSLIIDGFERGIASSPYNGIANMRGVNTSYYPGAAYVNYRRQAASFGNPLTPNLVSYWKLDESSGNAADAVDGNTLTNNNGVTYGAGKLNNCAIFSRASSQSLSRTNASQAGLNFSSALTASMWVNFTSLPVNQTYTLFSKWGSGQKSYAFNYTNATGLNSANFGTSNTNKSLTYAGNLGISNQNCTFSFWVKVNTEIASGTYTLFELNENTGTTDIRWQVNYNYNGGSPTITYVRQRVGIGSDTATYNSGFLGTSNWYLITMKCTTGSAGTLTGYVNGASVGTASTNGSGNSDPGNSFSLGFSTSGSNAYSSVKLDDVRVWNYVRTDADILSDYTSPTELVGTEANLKAYYTFDTSVTADLTANAFTLTNNNSVALSTDYAFLFMGRTSNQLQLVLSPDGTNTRALFVPYTFSVSTWYYVSVAWDGTTKMAVFSVNGSRVGTFIDNFNDSSTTTTIFQGTGDFALGVSTGDSTTYLNGKLDEVGAWSAKVDTAYIYGSGSAVAYPFTSATGTLTNPIARATSPAGLNYILDDSGQVWKQNSVNSTTWTIIQNGGGRVAMGHGGLAFWMNYLVVFGAGLVEFCGLGTGDSDVISLNWNQPAYGSAHNIAIFTTDFTNANTSLLLSTPNTPTGIPKFAVNDPIQFATTGTLPAGLLLNTTYYIKTINYSTFVITVSVTLGGSAVILTSDGSGTNYVIDSANPLPIGNYTNLAANLGIVGSVAASVSSYTDARGNNVGADWLGPTGLYNFLMLDGQRVPINLTNGTPNGNTISEVLYAAYGGTWTLEFLNASVTNYNPYASKVDGALYFCNGQFIGRIAEVTNSNISFNPGLPISYSVSTGVTALPEQTTDTVVDMVDLKSQLVVAGQKDIYTWDYNSASTSSPAPVGEAISKIRNDLNNIYVFSGQKGSIYISNGYSAQPFFKLPDFIAGAIDPVWSFGDAIVRRSKLFFQATAQDTSGNNLLAGVFSLNISANATGDVPAGALLMEAQNSYGLTPASGAKTTGVLIDNPSSSAGQDSYYSGWSNGASTGGIDYNDTSLWQNFEPTIETEIIPIGNYFTAATLGFVEFKLDRPMAGTEQIRMYARTSLSDAYTLLGTTSTTTLSNYFSSNIFQGQWVQFKLQFKCAASSPSFLPLREVRLHLQP